MGFTQTAGLRDREYANFIGANTGSISLSGVLLYAIESGTSIAIPVLCNSEGMLLTSGI